MDQYLDLIFPSTSEEAELIDKKITEFNKNSVAFTQKKDFIPLNFNIKDEQGKLIAGVNTLMYCWKVLYIDVLFVSEEHRGKKIGSALLTKVEREAKAQQVTLVHLDTFDFQAKDFYLKAGYEIFGVLEDCPKGHKRYYLKKLL